MKACRELFDEGGYDAVSFRTIGEKTSFSRPSIYNYYGTKEEVFLDLISQEYAGWREGIEAIRENGTPKTREEYASATTDCLRSHDRLTRLMSIHYTAISHNCSLDRLKAFQKTIQPFFDSLHLCCMIHSLILRRKNRISSAFFTFRSSAVCIR